jgi:hypothetical protein
MNPQTTQRWVYIFLGIKEPHGLPQEAHVTIFSIKTKMGK